MTHLDELHQLYSDLHKDVYGIRYRGPLFTTVEAAGAAIDKLSEELKVVEAEEQAQKDAAAVQVEARIKQLIETGAKDRPTAIRWLHEAHDTNGDDDYLAWTLGIRYGYFKVDAAARQ